MRARQWRTYIHHASLGLAAQVQPRNLSQLPVSCLGVYSKPTALHGQPVMSFFQFFSKKISKLNVLSRCVETEGIKARRSALTRCKKAIQQRVNPCFKRCQMPRQITFLSARQTSPSDGRLIALKTGRYLSKVNRDCTPASALCCQTFTPRKAYPTQTARSKICWQTTVSTEFWPRNPQKQRSEDSRVFSVKLNLWPVRCNSSSMVRRKALKIAVKRDCAAAALTSSPPTGQRDRYKPARRMRWQK